MKTSFNILLKFILSGLILINTSCKYDEIVDTIYPDSVIYLPITVNGSIATNGIYTINEGASAAWVSPTPGQPLKYNVNKASNEFIIPLGVYRSGTENKITKEITVDLALNQDTVLALINLGKLTGVSALPADKLQLPNTIVIQPGKNNSMFNLVLDLNFLRTDAPKKYAFAVTISSASDSVNSTLNTAIVVIDTQITIPKAQFTTKLTGSSIDTYTFTNSSLYWDLFSGEEAFSWNFGDGSPVSNETNPEHKFNASGQYSVTLTVKGIAGETTSVTNITTVQ